MRLNSELLQPPAIFSTSTPWSEDDTNRLLKIPRACLADGSFATFGELMIAGVILALKTLNQDINFEAIRRNIYGINPPSRNSTFVEALEKLKTFKGSEESISVLKKIMERHEDHWKRMIQTYEPFFEYVGTSTDLGNLLRNCSRITKSTTKYFDLQGNACNGSIPIEPRIHALQSV